MTAKKKYFIVGSSVMAFIVIALIVVSIIAEPNFFRPKVKVETFFSESVNGLNVGAPVKFRGVPIGEVTDIELSSKAYPQKHIFLFSKTESLADVKMILYMDPKDLREHINNYIEEGLRAQTQLAGLTGSLYVSLDFLDPKQFPAEKLPDNWDPSEIYIPSAPSLTTQISTSVNNFLARLDKLHLEGSIGDAFPDTQKFIESLDEIAKNIKGDSINILLTNFDKLLTTTSGKISEFDVKGLDSLVSELNNSAKKLDKQMNSTKVETLVRDINKLSTKFNNMVQNNTYDVRALMQSLLQVTETLNLLTYDLANDPSSFFRAPKERNLARP